MAWGGVILRAPENVSVAELPPDFTVAPLGQADDIRAHLEALFPGQHHVDGQSSVRGPEYWVEFNYGYSVRDDGTVESIGIRTNAGDGALAAIHAACDALDARLFDEQVSDFADLGHETESSMKAFADFRDRNINRHS